MGWDIYNPPTAIGALVYRSLYSVGSNEYLMTGLRGGGGGGGGGVYPINPPPPPPPPKFAPSPGSSWYVRLVTHKQY